MESNQSANGLPAAGKPVTGTPETGELNRKMMDVFDQALITLNDHVLDAQLAVRENTAQLRVMASSVELVRGLPAKLSEVLEGLLAVEERLETCCAWMNNVSERMDALDKMAMSKLNERMYGLEFSMRQLAEKPTALDNATEVLRAEMRKHAELFEKPQKKTVHHWHYLHYYGWIIFGLVFACAGLIVLWGNARRDAERNATNDILWRGARQVLDPLLMGELDTVKNRHDADPEQFRQDVIAEDEHNEELTEKLQEEAAKRHEADQKQAEANEKQQEADAAKQEAEELKKQKRKR
jgi:hypothetical protein